MNGSIEVEEQSTELDRVLWTFWLIDRTLTLAYYTVEHRETKRHHYKPVRRWARGGPVRRSQAVGQFIDRPSVPKQIQARALAKLVGMIQFENLPGDGRQ